MEISNKTLATFLVAAIVISLAGTIISLNKLGSFVSTTGFATSPTATANVQINSTSSIRFIVASVNWSSGSVNATGAFQNCTLDTNNTRSTDCIGFNTINQPLELENDGSVNVSVAIKADVIATTLFGTAASTHGTPKFQFNVTDNQTGSCVSGLVTGSVWWDFNTTDWTVCPVFYWDPAGSADALRFHIRVIFPVEATSGVKQATITATAT